ncbi:hypothetical protein [Pantoea trifolii]|uniref:hypothetical protein n=1 Tax=Candidatus Pantoea symbiotica TaxID=1884370 RepID=UPI0024131F37|nr:hypothetical protein [Pantoea rodasii]
MHEKLLPIKEKLSQLHKLMEDLSFPYEDFTAWGGTIFPNLSKDDVVYFPYELMARLEKHKKYEPNDNDIYIIDSIIAAIDKTKDNVQSLTSGNATSAASAINSFMISMFFVSDSLNNLFSFEILANRDLLPKRLLNRLAFYENKLTEIGERTGDVDNKISTINDAYDAAENLPTTLQNLRDTNAQVDVLKIQSENSNEEIVKFHKKSSETQGEIEKIASEIKDLTNEMKTTIYGYMHSYQAEAQNYIDKCEEAFRTTTSKGLAGAFQDKAQKLNRSIQLWVSGLVCALVAGAGVGYYRLQALEHYLADPNSSGLKLFVQLTLSVFSVGAPLWFAWLATKQIGQRFRLAEDYEFKASVSKAYEGYRREAMSLDDAFSQRLFGNALTRLEEPPLRFVEENSHSSPLMEMLSSDNFKDFFSRYDESVDSVMEKYGWRRKRNETTPNVERNTEANSQPTNNDKDEEV